MISKNERYALLTAAITSNLDELRRENSAADICGYLAQLIRDTCATTSKPTEGVRVVAEMLHGEADKRDAEAIVAHAMLVKTVLDDEGEDVVAAARARYVQAFPMRIATMLNVEENLTPTPTGTGDEVAIPPQLLDLGFSESAGRWSVELYFTDRRIAFVFDDDVAKSSWDITTQGWQNGPYARDGEGYLRDLSISDVIKRGLS